MKHIQFITEYNSNHEKLQNDIILLRLPIKPAIESEI